MFLCVRGVTYCCHKRTDCLSKDNSDRRKGVGSLNLVHRKCKCCVFLICKYDTW